MSEERSVKGYTIGFAAVVMLVLLRITIGWHFLYEGIWKITNPFSAEPFLLQAKGPLAPLFYSMVPDVDGRQRLILSKDEQGKLVVKAPAYTQAWEQMLEKVKVKYDLSAEQQGQAQKWLDYYKAAADRYLRENAEDIAAYFVKLELLEQEAAAGTNGALHQKQRLWERRQKLRGEVRAWLDELDKMGEGFRSALWDLLSEEQKARGPITAVTCMVGALPDWVPFVRTQTQLINLAVTAGITAIGLCLMIGLFTRLAALGGAAFLLFVVLCQFPWPTTYPPAPEVVGHSLLVDKNVVEMVALLALMVLPVGHWAGLDGVLYRCCCPRARKTADEAAQQ